VLWALTLLAVTSWPNPGVPQVGHADKVVHALLYGVLGWLVARAEPTWLTPGRALPVLAAIAAFAALDEWHQTLVPGRSGSVDDWAADVVGAALALTLAAYRRRRAAPI
jgi:VanZ family protein